MKLYRENVATYTQNGKKIEIDLCWEGQEPKNDKGRFYDFYDEQGECLNLGEPWYDDGEGIPKQADVFEVFNWYFDQED